MSLRSRVAGLLSRATSSAPVSSPVPSDAGPRYAPERDGEPDPGEVVWTWVPYEDDPTQGKDRPVLIVARQGATLVAVPMTSKDHDRDLAQEAADGRFWFDLGTGPGGPPTSSASRGRDSAGRPSEVRLDRFLTVDPADVRREG